MGVEQIKDNINFFYSKGFVEIIGNTSLSKDLKKFMCSELYRFGLRYNKSKINELEKEFDERNIIVHFREISIPARNYIAETFFGFDSKIFFKDFKNHILFEDMFNDLLKEYMYGLFKKLIFGEAKETTRGKVAELTKPQLYRVI